MKSWKIEPQAPQVANFVQCYWLLEKESDDTSHNYPKLNPDPSGTLIIAPEQQRYYYQNTANTFEGKGCHWIFPNSQTIQLDHSKPFIILGIKFHVGALYSLNIKPKQPVIDQVVNVDIRSILNVDGLPLLALLSQDRSKPESSRDLLDKTLATWLSNKQQDNHSLLCEKAVRLLSSAAIAEIGGLLHCSQRTIERSFSRVTGFTLKQCQSMNRFEGILNRLHQIESQDINWLDVVDEFGFSDQPHLIRHLKSILGAPPSEYAKQRDITIDIYGDFEPL